MRISDMAPPDTYIVAMGIGSDGAGPIHDRWWFTKSSGLKFGTSLNSIGGERVSEIVRIHSAEKDSAEHVVDQYLQRRKREQSGEAIRYRVFTLQS